MRFIQLLGIFLITIVITTSCKKDPNKQIDEGAILENTYHSDEIGWTMDIPEGWEIINREITRKREDQGLALITEASGLEYDVSALKQLLAFQKDRFHIFQSSSEKFDLTYEGEWEETKELVKELLYETYESNGIKIDTSSSKELIDDLEFDKFHITVYSPEGTEILKQDLYSRYINGYDFGVNLNYIDHQKKEELLTAWRSSKFRIR